MHAADGALKRTLRPPFALLRPTAGVDIIGVFRAKTIAMTKSVPDRLCADPKSKFHDAELMELGVGIRFNGVERNDVHEYCLSEGWIKVPVGRTLDRRGQPMCFTLRGKVEAWIKSDDAGEAGSEPTAAA